MNSTLYLDRASGKLYAGELHNIEAFLKLTDNLYRLSPATPIQITPQVLDQVNLLEEQAQALLTQVDQLRLQQREILAAPST